MRFTKLATDLRLVESQLVASLRVQSSTKAHAALLRTTASLNERLESYRPDSDTELREMIAFFANRSARASQSQFACQDLGIALRLANESIEMGSTPASVRDTRVRARGDVLETGVADPLEISARIADTTERLVAINLSNRYMAISKANADFNHTTPARMIDQHIEQVIGKRRYLERAGPELERALSGGPRSYVYPLQVRADERRFIRCEMHPVRDRADRLYCTLLRMTDVTASLLSGQSA